MGATKLDNIRALFGATLARELLEVNSHSEALDVTVNAWISNANYNVKKYTFILFINSTSRSSGCLVELACVSGGEVDIICLLCASDLHLAVAADRLVDCSAIKRSLDRVYAAYLPKNTHPFIYLSLEMPTKNVDCNVHPTKSVRAVCWGVLHGAGVVSVR